MRQRRAAGFSLLESTIAMAVIGLVAGTFLWGAPDQLRATSAAFRASAAHRLATSVLDEARSAHLEVGSSNVSETFSLALPDADVTRIVRVRDVGLLEVEAVVRWNEPGEAEARESRLVTLIATVTAREKKQ